MLANYTDCPLVTVNLMTCMKDWKLAARAIASIGRQHLDLKQIQLLILYDGLANEEAVQALADAANAFEFYGSPAFIELKEPTGYYTKSRNLAVSLPYNYGIYQAFLDADNEWEPDHLSGLLEAIRVPHPQDAWPGFVYARRHYVLDEGVENGKLPSGPSPLVEWTEDNCSKLLQGPMANFVDTGDILIGKSALYELCERTGCAWNPNVRRFGDWEMMYRLIQCSIRGRAVDQITNIYHWTGDNLQLTRRAGDDHECIALPEETYNRMVAEGLIVADPSEKPN